MTSSSLNRAHVKASPRFTPQAHTTSWKPGRELFALVVRIWLPFLAELSHGGESVRNKNLYFLNRGLKIISIVSIGRNARLFRASATVFLALIFVSASALAKRKDDVVVLHNGDRMTGEIKSLEHGVLSFKADYMSGSVGLDWKRVARIESKDQYIIILTNGGLYTGSLDLAPRSRDAIENFEIRAGNDTVKVKQDEVLTLQPSEAGFLKQLKGSIDYGFGYTSGNNQYQSQLSVAANYRRGATISQAV